MYFIFKISYLVLSSDPSARSAKRPLFLEAPQRKTVCTVVVVLRVESAVATEVQEVCKVAGCR